MPRFFVPSANIDIAENTVIIDGTDVNHIKNVLRYSVGDKLTVSDSSGLEYECVIESFSEKEVILKIKSTRQGDTEPGIRAVLFQGLPKKDKLEFIIQKSVELGVSEIYPVINERTVVKLDGKNTENRTERWNRIAESAAKQSGRMIVPKVHEPVSYKNAMEEAKKLDYIILPYENAEGMAYSASCIEAAAGCDSVGIFIGPEGGFSSAEVEQAKSAGAKIISLGKRILRTETAGLAVLSVLMFEKESRS